MPELVCQPAPRLAHAGAPISLLDTCCSYPALLFSLLLAIISLFLPANAADPDIGWHLRNAQIQLAEHTWLHQDAYSFTVRGAPWMNHEWLAELPFYAGWKLGGQSGLQMVTLLTLAAVFLGVFSLAFRASRSVHAAFFCTAISIFLGTVSFGPRTLLFGWVFLVVELTVLEHFARGATYSLWLLPPLFMLWVNAHGSWLIGLCLLIAFAASGWISLDSTGFEPLVWTRAQKKLLLLCITASTCALFLNPYGWRLVAYPFDLAFRQKLNIASVEEWRSLDFHSPRGRCFLLVLAFLFIAQLTHRRKWKLYEIAYLGAGVYAALTYSRFLFLAGILVLPLAAKDLAHWLPQRPMPNRPLLHAGIMVALLLALVPWQKNQPSAYQDGSYPVEALPFLKTFRPQGNVLNDYLWGGFLVWNAPAIPVFVDSRVDIFERAGVFKDYLDTAHLEHSRELLDKYRIRYVLFRRDTPLVYLLQSTPDWKVDYQDRVTILLERRRAIAP